MSSWPAFDCNRYLDARRPSWLDHELHGRVRCWGKRVHVHPDADEIVDALASGATLLTS